MSTDSSSPETVRSGDASLATEAATVGPSSVGGTAVAPRTGDVIGRYVVLDVIGSGGMGVVLAAYDPELDRKVALKLVRPGRAQDSDEIEREARIVAKLRHPNLVVVHDVGKTAAGVFLAMEFLEGTTLRVFQARGLSWREIVAVYAQAGRGLAAVHDADVVHGDFKPDNVLVVGTAREVKLLDFGIAHAAESPVRASEGASSPRGTAGYLAPELWHGAPPSRASDQFAFCVALFEALTGARPYDVPTLARKPPSGEGALPWTKAVPGWLRRVVARGLSFDPSKRAMSMHEMVDELVAGPARARTRGMAVLGAALVVGGIVAGTLRGDPCRQAEDEVRGHWSETREPNVRAGIDETFGARTYDELRPLVEPFLDDVAAAAHRACQVRGRDPGLDARRDRCIESGLAELEAIDGLVAGGPSERLAAASWIGLGRMTPLECADDEALQWVPTAAPELVASGELRDLMRRGMRVEMLRLVDVPLALDEVNALIPEVRGADPTLHARALFATSLAISNRGNLGESTRQLRLALEAAERAGSPADIAYAWLYLARELGQLDGTEAVEELAIDRARAIAERMDHVDVHLPVMREQARALDRRGDDAGAEAKLSESIALARQHDRTLAEVMAQTALVTYALRAGRTDDALAIARDASRHLDNRWLPQRERIGVIGALASALAANDLIDEAEEATNTALELATSPDGAVVTLQSALACNWCQGVGITCRTDRIPAACKRCIGLARRVEAATQGARSGLYLGFMWLADTAHGGGVEEAEATLAQFEGRREWDDARAYAAYALLPRDPDRALAIALEVCDAQGIAVCASRAAYVIAQRHPDPERRDAARRHMREKWQALDLDDRTQTLAIGLDLAESGMISREEMAPIVAARKLPCLTAWPAVDAWWRASAHGGAARSQPTDR